MLNFSQFLSENTLIQVILRLYTYNEVPSTLFTYTLFFQVLQKMMNFNSPLIEAKVSKVESSLSELGKEISKCTMYLEKLKQESEKIVGKLNKIPTTAAYLHEFVRVNSFLLKYINLLTEINCKFEVMEILESDDGISKSNKKYLDNVYQVFEQPVITEIKSSFEDRVELLENASGFVSDLYNNDKQRLESKVLEGGKVLMTGKCTEGVEKNLSSDFSDVIKSEQPEESNEFSNEVRVNQTKKLCEHAQDRSDFEPSGHNTSSDPANDSVHETDKIQHVKTLTCAFLKTEIPSEAGVPIEEAVKIETTDVGDEDKIPEYVEGESCIGEIRQLEIPPSKGKEFYINIKHIISPSEFYVHFADRNLNLLPELERELISITVDDCAESFSENEEVESAKAVLCRQLGSYALYYSKTDEMWYRVKVTDWYLNHKHDLVLIFLIDYGESKVVSFKGLQSMHKHLMKYPAFAQRCHLSGLRPLDVNDDGVFKWGEEAKEEMICVLDKAENIKILIAPNDRYHPTTSLPVLLWATNGRDVCVNKLLVEKKCAKALDVSDDHKVDDDLKTNEINYDDVLEKEELEKWNPMKEDYESYLNTYELNINDPAAVIYGYVDKNSKRVCSQYARTGKCYKGDLCQKEHMFLNPLGFTTDKEEVYKGAFNLLTPPSVNSIIRVLVTAIADVNEFYCIAHYQIENSEESLYALVDYINEKENIREMKKLLVPPSIGQVVLAKYSQDDCWYRAKVLESQPENDLFSLIFVDYGNKETVPLSSIRAIEPRYLHLPFQGMQCFIYGVGKNSEAPQQEAMKYLNEKILDMDLKIEVISHFPGDDVSLLVRVFDQNGTDIGKELITLKYGVEKEDIVLISDCNMIPG